MATFIIATSDYLPDVLAKYPARDEVIATTEFKVLGKSFLRSFRIECIEDGPYDQNFYSVEKTRFCQTKDFPRVVMGLEHFTELERLLAATRKLNTRLAAHRK